MLKSTIVAAFIMSIFAMPASAQSPAGKGYMDAMSKMQTSMPKDQKGDPDTDFARTMIPHHRGAMDMAKVELQYGKDPELRKMAEKMIKDQEKEVDDLEKWLKQKGK